ncbi:MAG: hypothetical protein V9G19_21740 [Tetrasphaera sp.]
MGSIIKLFTPSKDFSVEHNDFIRSIPPHVLELVYVIKDAYRPEWGADWRSHFSVSRVNGRLGNRLRLDGQQVRVDMLRVGFEEDGSSRLFSLRPDFAPAVKVQTEDDITASVVVVDDDHGPSAKFVENGRHAGAPAELPLKGWLRPCSAGHRRQVVALPVSRRDVEDGGSALAIRGKQGLEAGDITLPGVDRRPTLLDDPPAADRMELLNRITVAQTQTSSSR